MDKKIVMKSNQLIMGRYNLTLIEQRLIATVATMIKLSDKEFTDYDVSISEYAWLANDEKKTNEYRQMKNIADSILKKPLFIEKPDGGFVGLNWFSSIEYIPKTGTLRCRFDEKLKPYLLRLKKNFTKYQLENILRLRSKYSIRLYEILRANAWRKTIDFDLDDLRKMISIPESYPYQMIKTQILNKAKKELKATDIEFTFKPIKRNRRVVKILFAIVDKKQQLLDMGEPNPESTTDEHDELTAADLLALIPKEYATDCKKIVLDALKKHDAEYISNKIRYVNERKKTDNYVGYLHDAITKNYVCNKVEAEKKREELERKQAEEKQRLEQEREAAAEYKKKFSKAEKIFREKSIDEQKKLIDDMRRKNNAFAKIPDEILRLNVLDEIAQTL